MKSINDKILELREKGYTTNQITAELGITKGKVCYVVSKRFKEAQKHKKDRDIAEKEFEELVKKYLPISNSLNNLCNYLGLKGVEGYYNKIRRIITKFNLSTEHFGTIQVRENKGRNKYTAMSNEEFFVKDKKRSGKQAIKRLLDSGICEYKCGICGIEDWMGKPLSFHLHHLNGKHTDNRIENLQLLCPNCHSQTENYAKGNKNVENNSFKVTERAKEISKNIKSNFIEPENKQVIKIEDNIKYCIICGNKIGKYGEKYCSLECAKKAARCFEVTSDELLADFKELKSYRQVGLKYGVSDNAIKKRTKKLGIFEEIQQCITHR